MAFGKNNQNLGTVGSFRGQARAYKETRPQTGGNFGGAQFRDKFQPSLDEPDNIRIIRGNYPITIGEPDGSSYVQDLSYFPYVEHFHGSMKKSCICSSGPFGIFKGKGEPCRGCEQFWADRNAGRKNGPMSKRELWGFTVLHYASYAKVPQVDRTTGQARTNDQGVAYTEWAHVLPHKRHEFQNVEMRDHHVMHWSMGSAHSGVLLDYDKEIGKSCTNCGTRDSIRCVVWACPNCGEGLIDPTTTSLSPKELEEVTSNEANCGACHTKIQMQEIIECSGCGDAKRADIFDVDLRVKRSADPTARNQNGTKLMVTGWSNPGPIDQRYAETAKPLPLDKIFAPTPYEKQLEIFGEGNRAQVDPSQLSRPYPGGNGVPTFGGPGGTKY